MRRVGGTKPSTQFAFVGGRDVVTKADEHDTLDGLVAERLHFAHRDLRGLIDRIAIHAATDRRKRDRLHAVLRREPQAVAIARREQLRLPPRPAPPHPTDGVDDVARRQPVAARDARFAGGAAAKGAALRDELRAGRAMDRAVDAASAEEGGVRGIDDGIDVELGDVAAMELEFHKFHPDPERSEGEGSTSVFADAAAFVILSRVDGEGSGAGPWTCLRDPSPSTRLRMTQRCESISSQPFMTDIRGSPSQT